MAILTLRLSLFRCWLRMRASSRMATSPEALSVTPGEKGGVSMWPLTRMNFSGSLNPLISATRRGRRFQPVSTTEVTLALTPPF